MQQVAACVTCHAWNVDGSMCAVCPNDASVRIYGVAGGTWTLLHTLSEHDQVVTGIDWGAQTNRIVTASQDRNAYVWQWSEEEAAWKPTLVILRLNRAATCVKWSPKENKFAVGSGSKLVSVCYFEEDNDWWVSKIIKKHKSTVLSIAWRHDNFMLATGCSDNKCRVFNAYIKGVDVKKPEADAFGVDPKKTSFGEVLAEFNDSKGWVHAVQWSPSGDTLAFAGHDSSLCFATIPKEVEGESTVQTVKTKGLPFVDVAFTAEASVLAVGHDCAPRQFVGEGGEWTYKGFVSRPGGADAAQPKKENKFKANMAMWGEKVDHGGATGGKKKSGIHDNSINCLQLLGSKFSTSGYDGRVVLWDLAEAEAAMALV